MRDRIAQLKHEIEECERQVAARPFGALLDKKRSDQLYHRLKKKRKELARAEGVTSEAPSVPAAKAAPAPKPKPKAKAKPEVKSKPKAKPKAKATAKKAAGKGTAKTATGGKAKRKSPAAKSAKTTKRPKAAAPKKAGVLRTGARKKT